MRRKPLVVGGALAAVAVAALVAWRLSGPPKLGLERSRVVVAAGEAHLDDGRAEPAQVVPLGAVLYTGRGSVCFSVHASRVCAGTTAEIKLAELGPSSAEIEVKRGTVIVQTAGDELRLTFPSGSVTAERSALLAVEEALAGTGPTVRMLDGSARIERKNQPAVTVTAPDAVGQTDGKKRPPAATLEREARSIAKLAAQWQGSAGGVISVREARGRVEIDGADVGLAPASVLLNEGRHTLLVRDGGRERINETVQLRAGETIVRGG
jgi:hypothetical protein